MAPVIYADLRCLQDPLYRFRGVGHHVAGVLRQRSTSECARWKLVGLVDEALPPLPGEYAGLADEISRSTNPPVPRSGAVFIDGSPMTHDPHFNVRFTSDRKFLNAAVIYDFIQLDWPGYLPTAAQRIEFLSRVARLRSFDVFFPISEYSGWRLSEIAGIAPGAIRVTGAAVRSRIYEIRRQMPPQPPRRGAVPYFLTVGGGDRRKNTEVAVAAVRRLNGGGGHNVALQVVGHYDDGYKAELLEAAGHPEGAGFVQFRTGIDDDTLVSLYAGAAATICPSHIEGFSLPVVESAACGTPVIASSCGAHLELIRSSEALFFSRDDCALSERLERILREPEWRERLVREQAGIAEQFHESEVGARFWAGIADAISVREKRFQIDGTRRRPRVAFLTPFPPDRSGVARYTQETVQAAVPYFDVDVYTDALRPLGSATGFRDAGRIGIAPLLKGRYDSIISVIGNSHFHLPVFEVFERHGGPCILHDSRLVQIYYYRLGHQRFMEFAASLLGRGVRDGEVETWLQDRDLPSLFVERIIERANPLIVHTRQYQALLRERYGVTAEVTAFCPNMHFSEEELSPAARRGARARLGVPSDRFLISTFGFVSKAKGMEQCIIAVDFLRGWNIPAELHFVGDTLDLAGEIRRVAGAYGVSGYIHAAGGFVNEHSYRDYMLASDAAVQLRTYGLGQPSAALADCISAALPCVASSELAQSCDAPAYVLTVPERSSPLQLAEQLATIWEHRGERSAHMDHWRGYLDAHSFDHYVRRLSEILGLG